MADQSIKVEGDSGSRERVALDLMLYIRRTSADKGEGLTKQEIIDLYVDCLYATQFQRHGEPR